MPANSSKRLKNSARPRDLRISCIFVLLLMFSSDDSNPVLPYHRIQLMRQLGKSLPDRTPSSNPNRDACHQRHLSCSRCPYCDYCERRVDVVALTAILFANPGCCSFLSASDSNLLSRRFAMSKLGCSLLGVSILCLVPSFTRAQESAPPKVLTITREFVKPYRNGEAHE